MREIDRDLAFGGLGLEITGTLVVIPGTLVVIPGCDPESQRPLAAGKCYRLVTPGGGRNGMMRRDLREAAGPISAKPLFPVCC